MVTYSYECTECGHQEEQTMGIKDHVAEVLCEKCDGLSIQFIGSPPHFDSYFEGSYKKEEHARKNEKDFWEHQNKKIL